MPAEKSARPGSAFFRAVPGHAGSIGGNRCFPFGRTVRENDVFWHFKGPICHFERQLKIVGKEVERINKRAIMCGRETGIYKNVKSAELKAGTENTELKIRD